MMMIIMITIMDIVTKILPVALSSVPMLMMILPRVSLRLAVIINNIGMTWIA